MRYLFAVYNEKIEISMDTNLNFNNKNEVLDKLKKYYIKIKLLINKAEEYSISNITEEEMDTYYKSLFENVQGYFRDKTPINDNLSYAFMANNSDIINELFEKKINNYLTTDKINGFVNRLVLLDKMINKI